MSEMEQAADRLVVIGRGRLIADATTEEILRGLGSRQVRVRTPQPDQLLTALRERGCTVRRLDAQELQVDDGTAADVGEMANAAGIPLHHLSEVQQSLEAAYLELTSDSVEFHGGDGQPTRTAEAVR
jgi:ABC-2 type transport system ATP-binding protein